MLSAIAWPACSAPPLGGAVQVDVLRPSAATAGTIRSNHEDRAEGEVRPGTVEQAVRQAHVILAGAGVTLAPSKVTRLCRDFLRADPSSSFRSYLIRNAGPSLASHPLPPNRHGLEWVDPTGNTAARNVDRERGVADRAN